MELRGDFKQLKTTEECFTKGKGIWDLLV